MPLFHGRLSNRGPQVRGGCRRPLWTKASDLRPRETVTTITHDADPDPEFLETRGIAHGTGCKRPTSQITLDCTRRAVTSMFIVFLLHLTTFFHLVGIYIFLAASFLEGCPFLPSPLVPT